MAVEKYSCDCGHGCWWAEVYTEKDWFKRKLNDDDACKVVITKRRFNSHKNECPASSFLNQYQRRLDERAYILLESLEMRIAEAPPMVSRHAKGNLFYDGHVPKPPTAQNILQKLRRQGGHTGGFRIHHSGGFIDNMEKHYNYHYKAVIDAVLNGAPDPKEAEVRKYIKYRKNSE